ncbi:zinc finger CCHC domain-containing protein 17 [Pundamilia nyererei]|uniref:Zinc finger CCHC domain-containing protein 17 n=4 Tax=Haplochromini TaxID=319058 RepID=A0A3B4FQJ6_9CICH|nr:nucleolar protein of 40 kDa [Maylandia zebra]XP_004548077.1 nucleolar protein of 40 kDa [Maylandia zebra]XP_005728379.1 PREDICTED: nucleolar protein of 40 kDa [Pundamilia nyererei]XP_005933035.1 nucleolar protein of 40 kDa [Haplochromis burtoni]XP_026011836.1 nucleolar protein of 40 kDa [Astatotilapia calliptera]
MSDRDRRPSEPAGLDGLPPLYSIAKGEVVSVQTYGAFVRLPGYRKEGLVHVSEMSASRVENASEIVDVGEHVWIKVIGREIQGDKVKLSFSMKAVNQGTGRDLDPNNVMAEQDSRRRKQFRDQTSNRITLEAVLNTTCSKCGCKGHFTKDCFSAPGLQYALLPEEDDEEPQQQPSTAAQHQDSDKKKKKKEKKAKKKSKKRERKESESDSSSSSSSECKSKRRRQEHERDRDDKKKKKHKKHKSHKHS